MSDLISRRELFKRAGVVGAGVVSAPLVSPTEPTTSAAGQVATTSAREPLETLTAAEADVLEAMVARIIPTDANGPGANEARAAHYIDRALGGFLAPFRDTYASGLAALDAYAQSSRRALFAQLSAVDQDAVLKVFEKGEAPGLPPSSVAFFALVRQHTIEGTFCDPFYGGNAHFVGWDLIRYPGVRTMVTADEQKMTPVKPNHRSAYDYLQFTKASPNGAESGGMQHGK